MSTSSTPPKKGDLVELKGLVAKPELNGCTGVIVTKYDSGTGRCGVNLDGGTKVNAKLANIVVLDPKAMLERALEKLKEAGGREDEANESDDDEDDKDPVEYLDELMAVGQARYNLGEYDKAGGIYYTAYYAAMHRNGVINDPGSFPYAHKMLEAWSKSDDKYTLKKAHGMAHQTLMMPGCPRYIRDDLKTIEKNMKRKGHEVPEDPMTALRKNMANFGMGF